MRLGRSSIHKQDTAQTRRAPRARLSCFTAHELVRGVFRRTYDEDLKPLGRRDPLRPVRRATVPNPSDSWYPHCHETERTAFGAAYCCRGRRPWRGVRLLEYLQLRECLIGEWLHVGQRIEHRKLVRRQFVFERKQQRASGNSSSGNATSGFGRSSSSSGSGSPSGTSGNTGSARRHARGGG